MNVQELAESAIKRINFKSPIQTDKAPVLQLIMPIRGKQPESCYLAGRNSPKGRVLGYQGNNEGGNPMMLVNFDAWDVLAFAIAKGAKVTAVMPDGLVVDFPEEETAVSAEGGES